MISINVGGNRPGPSPCFPEHVDAQAGGSALSGKHGRTLSVLSRGMVETKTAFLPELQPYV